jgi:trans-aconitate methyltransferase
MRSLSFPGPRELTAREEFDFSDMVSRIYRHCQRRREPRAGRPYMTWNMDLRARNIAVVASPQATPEKLEGLSFTPHMNEARDVVGSQFQFRFARATETFYVGERIEFTALQTCISGNEFERVFPASLSESVAEGQWDGFGRGVTADVSRHYETVIYPRVVETLSKIAAMRPGRPLHVVDLGGGSGRLAEILCEEVPEAGRVTVVERSDALVAEARARATRHPGRLVAQHADITADDFWGGIEEPPDVFVLCGVVAHQVIEHAEALHLMQRCFGKLAVGGFVLLPSYSPALLTSNAYEVMGFAVHNKTLSFFEDTSDGRALRTNDFYILEKKA